MGSLYDGFMSKAESMKCRIGGLRINPQFLPYDDTDKMNRETDNGPYHLFVIEVRDQIASIFVGDQRTHNSVVCAIHLSRDDIQGGGFLYLDPDNRLTLGDSSGSFGSAPEVLLERFVSLIAAQLNGNGTNIAGTKVKPDPETLNDFWKG